MKKVILLSILATALYGPPGAYAGNSDTVYTVARAPQRSHIKTIQDWEPFIKNLEQTTGIKLKLKVYTERSRFEQDLVGAKADFFYGNPGYFIVAQQAHGYLPLVRSSKKQLKGIIVVRRAGPLQSIEQLQGKTLAFPAKSAFAASLYIRSILDKFGIEIKAHYVKGHDNVYRSVANGSYTAGGGVYRTLGSEPDALKNQIRVLYETPGMAPHPLFAHPRVPEKVRKKMIDSILEMDNHAEGKQLLNRVKIRAPIKADYQRDYASIKEIALKMYQNLMMDIKLVDKNK